MAKSPEKANANQRMTSHSNGMTQFEVFRARSISNRERIRTKQGARHRQGSVRRLTKEEIHDLTWAMQTHLLQELVIDTDLGQIAVLDKHCDLDSYLPEQATNTKRETHPLDRICFAMLEIAYRDLFNPLVQVKRNKTQKAREEDYASAMTWIFDQNEEEETWPLSFTGVCSILDLDPNWMRNQFTKAIATNKKRQFKFEQRGDKHVVRDLH